MVVIVNMTGVVDEDLCGWTKRCEMHCKLLDIEHKVYKFDIQKANDPSEEITRYWVKGRPLPIVWVDGELIGGFYDLIERFPIL